MSRRPDEPVRFPGERFARHNHGPIDEADCTFCAMVAGKERSLRIYEDEHTVAFMDRLPMTDGHCLVIPRRHVTDIWELTDVDAAQVMQAARQVAHLVRERLQPPGVNLLNNNGRAAFQSEFHFHIHVVPRYGDDQLLQPWERWGSPAVDPARIQEAYQRLRSPEVQAPTALAPDN